MIQIGKSNDNERNKDEGYNSILTVTEKGFMKRL